MELDVLARVDPPDGNGDGTVTLTEIDLVTREQVIKAGRWPRSRAQLRREAHALLERVLREFTAGESDAVLLWSAPGQVPHEAGHALDPGHPTLTRFELRVERLQL